MARQVIFKDVLTIRTIGGMANELLNALQGGQDVTADFSGVERIDSAALQVLLAGFKEAEINGVSLSCVVPDNLQRYATSIGISFS